MKKQTRVWKVLRSDTRTSCGIDLKSPHSICYPVGEFVKAKVGKVFCFLKKTDAMQFKKSLDLSCHIHKAIGINVNPIYEIAFDSDTIKAFWSGKPSGVSAPKGSCVCDSIKCLD